MNKKTPPNILLIVTDQLRADCLGHAGHPCVQTPFLNQFAKNSIRFSHAYSPVASCIPARASLMTGMDANHTGVAGMGAGNKLLDSQWPHTLPGELAQAGYHNFAVGHLHFHPWRILNSFHEIHLDEPIDDTDYVHWFNSQTKNVGYFDHADDWNGHEPSPWPHEEHLHPVAWTTDTALRCMDRRDPEKPFFMKVSYLRPHSPYDPPQHYINRYANASIPMPFESDWSKKWEGPLAKDAWHGSTTQRHHRLIRQAYYGIVSFLDDQIKRLVQTMYKKDQQAMNNTWIIFTSDHGDMLGDHNLWRKTYAYESCVRIPMVIRPPDSWQGPRDIKLNALVEIQDIMPTLLQAAGLQVPTTCTGQSMIPLLTGEYTSSRDYVHGQHTTCYTPELAHHFLTDGKEKYIWFPETKTEQFFDLQVDPDECNDLAQSCAATKTINAWRKKLKLLLLRFPPNPAPI